MSTAPNESPVEDGTVSGIATGRGSGNLTHPSGLKYSVDEQGAYPGFGGKVTTSDRHDHHILYDMGQDTRMPKAAPRNEARDADRRSPVIPNMLFRVSTFNDSHSERVDSESRIELRDATDSIKEPMAESRDIESESRELQQSAKYNSRGDDCNDVKHEKDTSSELKGDVKLDKDGSNESNSQVNWNDLKEHRPKHFIDTPGGTAETWHPSRTSFHGPADTSKEGLTFHGRDFAETHEAVGENKVDMKVDDKFKDKDQKRKELKHRDWVERDRHRSDRRNILQPGNSGNENKVSLRDEREPDRWGNEKKDPLKEREKDPIKKESWNVSEKEALHSEKELVDDSGKVVAQDISNSDLPKKDTDREVRDRKKERDADVESERPDKRIKYHDNDSEEGCMVSDVGTEREKEIFVSGVHQRKRMLRPRGSPQTGNRDPRVRLSTNDNEGSQGKTDMSCVVYKIGECMQELIRLWKEYESSLADKACESSQNGPTLEIRIPAEHVTATNRQVRGGQLWGTDIYTVDSDLVAVLMHAGYCRPTASPPPSAAQELRATIRVLPPKECYVSTLRNNVRSRAWGAAIGCSYRVEQCCIVKKGGGIIVLEPYLTHSSTMEPTLAPMAVERTMTTRSAASNALRQPRFVREVTILFNLCMEPWLKYSISAVADKGLKKVLFTSSRLKKGEVLYLETHSQRYELCFNMEKVVKVSTAPYVHGSETGRTIIYNSHHSNGERNVLDAETTVVDIFRWSRCKRPLPQKIMQNMGIPLPGEYLEVLDENLEWDDISWLQTGVWIAGREYALARAHFLSPI